jgi:hypothetical protein
MASDERSSLREVTALLSRAWKANPDFFLLWGSFGLIALLVFFFLSDGDFSFLLSLSSMLSCLSFVMVIYNIRVEQSVRGVSLRMVECYLVVTLFRLTSILTFDGYLPYDRSGDFIYRLTECITAALTASVVYLCRVDFRASYELENDTGVNHIIMIGACFVFAVFFHPSLNQFTPTDIAWAFALYLEAVAAMPQLFLFRKTNQVQPFISHFLAGQVTSKAFALMFWVSSYHELSDRGSRIPTKHYVGYVALVMQCMQILIMGDFMYKYILCLTRGVSVAQILESDVV